jgi:PelA/Pel-15E family pectate lyase
MVVQAESMDSQALKAMKKAGSYWATDVASHGGFVWEYSTDFKRRRGESKDLPPTTLWVQPPGTPAVGVVFLKVYEITKDKLYLDAALSAGKCLAAGQLKSGGWGYSIEFDPKRYRYRHHHVKEGHPKWRKLSDTTTFDDNNTQSATRFLLELSKHTNEPEIDVSLKKALTCFLEAQYKGGKWDGAWAQRYPPPKKGYGALPTFNDNTMSDCVRTMLLAWKILKKPEYKKSVLRCLDFFMRSQMPSPQAGWAQQYDKELQPAWARKFEPPAVSGAESSGNVGLLMDMYIEFGDKRYLEAVGRAVEWYRNSRIGGDETKGQWARFYEPKTNKPLYFTRTYELVYTDDDLPIHYSFKGNYNVDKRIAQYERIVKKGRNYYLNQPRDWKKVRADLQARVEEIITEQDEQGRWVKVVKKSENVRDKKGRLINQVDEKTELSMMYSRDFVRNMNALASYVEAGRQE